MYVTTIHDAASSTARFRMPELCLEQATGAVRGGSVDTGVVALDIRAIAPAFKDATTGVRAWSPPD